MHFLLPYLPYPILPYLPYLPYSLIQSPPTYLPNQTNIQNYPSIQGDPRWLASSISSHLISSRFLKNLVLAGWIYIYIQSVKLVR